MTEVNARWRPSLDAVPGMSKSLWRKSPQQFMLLRKHAELVAYDEVLFKAFETVRCAPQTAGRTIRHPNITDPKGAYS